ncbi:MAG: DsbA family protein [Planctomycetes bacterium]|nr:DsbA family protein [Planctomycetota bacterium]
MAFPFIKTKYIDTGRVRWVYRHYAFLRRSEFVAQASECADDQDMFWEYHDALFESIGPLPFSDESLKAIAADLELSESTFDSCLDDGDRADRVQADFESCVALGVMGTPTFYVLNGVSEPAYLGFRSGAEFEDILDVAFGELAGEPEIDDIGFGQVP